MTTETIDMTPSWGEWTNVYARFAESGEIKACLALRKDLARIAAMAEGLRAILPELTKEQKEKLFSVMRLEMAKQGF